MSSATFKRLVRFIPKPPLPTDGYPLIGQPKDESLDVGLAHLESKPIEVSVFSGTSVLQPGHDTGRTAIIDKLLSPLSQNEVGTLRCIGFNYKRHCEEVGAPIPKAPEIFTKPATSLSGPYPTAVSPIPKISQETETGDFESELCVVLGKECKNVSEEDAMQYVLGYTASNDVSCRHLQFSSSQFSYSKSFDGAAPIGPTLVAKEYLPEFSKVTMRGILNGKVMQETALDDLVFSVSKLVSFISRSTTLTPGTLILTGTPAGVGFKRDPKIALKDGDEFRVEVLPLIGTLVNKFVNE